MKEIQKLSFEEELQREADAIEKELEADPDLKELELPEDFDRKMEERLRAIEKERFAQNTRVEKQEERQEEYESRLSEKDREALELGRKMLEQKKRSHRRIPRKAKVWLPLAASMILVLACGITSVGSKSYWKNLWKRMLGEQKNTVINVEDMDVLESKDGEKVNCYWNINEELGRKVVYPRNVPKGMVVSSYEVDTTQDMAKVLYDYNNQNILYAIYVNEIESSYSEKVPDIQTDEFDVTNEKQTIHVMEYRVRDTKDYRYVANFEYQGIHYRLKGIMNRSDFEEILKNLYYF